MDCPAAGTGRPRVVTGEQQMTKPILTFLVAIMMPAGLYAVDGQVLINQASVNAQGGFPYVISTPGSYKLSGNLIINDANKTAILIAQDFVTLDLGGFSIIGPNDCSSGTCSANGNGSGIETLENHVYFNITIRNGTIQGMGNGGIMLFGDSFLVEYMHIRSNGKNGISLSRFALSGVAVALATVQHCTSELNSDGILIEGGLVTNNNASRNRNIGIHINRGTAGVIHNVMVGNLNLGLVVEFGGTASYSGNVLNNGNANDVGEVIGSHAVNMGQNLCGTAACPGAVY
jgi:hypothetical protein